MRRANKYGIIRVVSRWLDLLPQILVSWRVLFGYAAALTVLSAVLSRWSYTCAEKINGYWCFLSENNGEWWLGSVLLWTVGAFYLYCLFAGDFYDNILSRRKFRITDIFAVSKQRLRSVGMFFACLLCMIIPCIILIYILNPMKLPTWHTSNPDWRIELIYFTIAFVCMSIPLIIMRCGGGIAYFFNEGHIPFRKVYDLTFNRTYVGIFSFLLLTLLCVNLQMGVMRYFMKLENSYNLLTTAVVTEFCNNVMLLFYISLFLLLFQAEYLVLKEKEECDKLQIITEPEEKDEPAKEIIGKSKKSAKKKKSQRKAKKITEKNGD